MELTDEVLRGRVIAAIERQVKESRSQRAAAAALGISESTICQWRRGQKLSRQLAVLRLVLGDCQDRTAA